MRVTVLGAYCISLVVIAACSDSSPSAPGDVAPQEIAGLVISDPGSVSTGSFNAVAAGGTTSYVSANPGTFPGAFSTTIRNRTHGGAEKTATVIDGGFDPVAILAESGDELSVELSYQSGPVVVTVKVPPKRPPSVVRTIPPHGRTDVALNVEIVVVFSEPINRSTVNSTSLSLKEGGVTIDASFAVSADGLTATLLPQHPLSGLQSYQIDITRDIRDLDGDQLEEAVVATFVTEDAEVFVPSAETLSGTLAFVSTRDGVSHIYVSKPDGSGIRRLTSLAQAEFTPAWSRDGELLAFSTENNTYVVRKDGSELTKLPVAGAWPSWSPDGKRLLVMSDGKLRIVPLDGSPGTDVDVKLDGTGSFIGPAPVWAANWSPDGNRIAFGAWTDFDFQRSFIANVDGSDTRTFVDPFMGAIWDECGPVWSPDGTKIALLGGVFGGLAPPVGIFAIGIVDPQTGSVTPIAVTGTTCWDDDYGPTSSFSGVAWSPDGTMLAITKWDAPRATKQQASIAIIDINTKVVRAVIPDAYDPAWSRLQ